jgi:alpha-D-ribose 1-methylphosphonate 5-triphosphate diphosphatase
MWWSDFRLVLPDRTLERGSVRVENGIIAEIIEGPAPKSRSLEAHTVHGQNHIQGQNLTLIPGIVDLHGDMIERELEPRPGTYFPVEIALQELDKRLVSNGITTAYAAIALADGPGLRSEDRARTLIQAIADHKAALSVEMLVHARFEVTMPAAAKMVAELLERGHIQMVSLMDHTPGQGQFRDLEYYVRYMTKWLGGDSEKAAQSARAGVERPAAWDIGYQVAHYAREHGVPLASHDDDTPSKVDLMHTLGTSIAEFPVTLEAALEAKARGMTVLMGAPNALRGGSHSGNLSARVALEAGVLDGLAADYHPASLLQAAFKFAKNGLVTLPQAINLITVNVARAANLLDRGSLVVGMKADLVAVQAGDFPRVRGTWRSGNLIFADGALQARGVFERVFEDVVDARGA